MIVKDPASSAAKWSSRASAAGAAYTSGVASSTKDQAALAAAAEPVWAAAVSAAASNHIFSAQVTKAGTGAWKAGVAAKGGARYPSGVTAAQPKYAANIAPYLTALSSLTLPPRGVKGSNIGRVQAVDDALMATKKTVK